MPIPFVVPLWLWSSALIAGAVSAGYLAQSGDDYDEESLDMVKKFIQKVSDPLSKEEFIAVLKHMYGANLGGTDAIVQWVRKRSLRQDASKLTDAIIRYAGGTRGSADNAWLYYNS